jgi:hypothetical protein
MTRRPSDPASVAAGVIAVAAVTLVYARGLQASNGATVSTAFLMLVLVVTSVARWPHRFTGSLCAAGVVAALAATAAGCARPPQTALVRLLEARRLSADLLVQFSAATDAANRAVMADTDDASMAFAREADGASAGIQYDSEALAPILRDLSFLEESRLLEEFGRQFTEYRGLDRSVLDLAVENTNVKAQRLSFGPAQNAVDGFRESLAPLTAGDETGQVAALVATAMASVREIQVLQAPHIAESDDTAMSRLEQRMAAAQTATRNALASLGDLVAPASRPQLEAATAALDRFAALNTEIVALSRRNTNVRSLALTLGQKQALVAACEETLRSLQAALSKRGFAATR